MHCVRVVTFVKTLGLPPLRSLGIWAFTYLALHRSKHESKVCYTNGARIVRIVLAMHVPNLGIHTLWRFPCASIHSSLLSTGQKGKCLLVLASP